MGNEVSDDMGRFHALFRRGRPGPGAGHVVLDTKGSPGVHMGTVISALPRSAETWREGEMRFHRVEETQAYRRW